MKYFVIVVLSILFAANSWSGVGEANALYKKQDYSGAFTEFMRAAEIGDHLAQFNVGAMYYRGEHVAKDNVQAYAWMVLAGQKDNEDWRKVATALYAELNDDQKKQADQAKETLFSQFSDEVVAAELAPELGSNSSAAGGVRVLKKVGPEYPRSMLAKAQLGRVEILFTVAPDGTTRNHLVTYAT